jgi:hypothetical protein
VLALMMTTTIMKMLRHKVAPTANFRRRLSWTGQRRTAGIEITNTESVVCHLGTPSESLLKTSVTMSKKAFVFNTARCLARAFGVAQTSSWRKMNQLSEYLSLGSYHLPRTDALLTGHDMNLVPMHKAAPIIRNGSMHHHQIVRPRSLHTKSRKKSQNENLTLKIAVVRSTMAAFCNLIVVENCWRKSLESGIAPE